MKRFRSIAGPGWILAMVTIGLTLIFGAVTAQNAGPIGPAAQDDPPPAAPAVPTLAATPQPPMAAADAPAADTAPPMISPEQMARSAVMIRSVSQPLDPVMPWKRRPMSQGVGTGFIIDDYRILTNAHNVSDARYVEIKKQDQAQRWPAIVMYIGHDCDLALLTVLDKSFFEGTVPLELGPLPAIHSTVQTYGFPVGGRQISVTEGVVSRIEHDVYSHTGADSHVVVQTDAAINPGNSGGPVMQNGKVVGVAFQGLTAADNIGYMVPTTVIRHFLDDVADHKYDGFGSLGFSFYNGLHNRAYARYLNLPDNVQGIVVLHVMMNSSVEGILQRNDVISRIDDYAIDNDGMIRIDGRQLHFSEAVERKQIGQTVTLTFWRNGQEHTAEVAIAWNRPVLDYSRQYDAPPRYVVYAGLTFVPVSRNYLEAWGRTWMTDIPPFLRYLFQNSLVINKDPKRKEFIALAAILPDPVNAYAGPFEDRVVEKINGRDIRSLEDLADALGVATTTQTTNTDAPTGPGDTANTTADKIADNGYIVIEFMDADKPLVLDRAQAADRHPAILKKYQVPAPASLETQP